MFVLIRSGRLDPRLAFKNKICTRLVTLGSLNRFRPYLDPYLDVRLTWFLEQYAGENKIYVLFN